MAELEHPGQPCSHTPECERWGSARVAAHLGVKLNTWSTYWHDSTFSVNNPAPQPDGWFDGRTPWWWSSTILAWVERRPGPGGRGFRRRQAPSTRTNS